ncbi:Polyketide cyclase / dehydrase and lipid transport [Rhodospirillales bacterium URHD0017]|nr:Polyketide cyclase / dehydrase and lipid transport [Rhodospirillales bacterium URHD0017]
MLKTLAIIGVVVVVAIAGILLYAATRPDSFRVQRVVLINAPPDKIFALINDFKAWPAWSPYEKKDPAMKRAYGAVTAGKGATYAWEGDKNVGQGSMEMIESSPQKIVIKLDFLKPFEAHNIGEFLLEPKGDSTSATWAIHGPSPYMSKVVGTFMNIDDMIGRDFEKGLADLKAAAEKK